jgi:hypothetical protein
MVTSAVVLNAAAMPTAAPSASSPTSWSFWLFQLRTLMFLKEKQDKTVKGRMCADGQKQRSDQSKQELTLPTVAMKYVFIMPIVDAYKGRDVASFDIPGAFLHIDSEKDITMILRGRLAELMVQVAPNFYRKYITVDRKRITVDRK